MLLVLIDTWWNVNFCQAGLKTKVISFNRYMVECEYFFITFIVTEKTVLIDTWWNVNTEKKLSSLESIGFNRYMVECELYSAIKDS